MYATTDLNILKECANVNDRTNDQIYNYENSNSIYYVCFIEIQLCTYMIVFPV